ncbi:hypothetical protein B9Z19DRAFT_1194690 [Tuber borchii]|uniref:Uncharacterized protein n=1 Tax=Tuber borchii TaxID=42251 RepID=A0A2T6ZM04_TUBBO|nr:hypothetical protein B9Z19DRAFT_1194690 [Tuber borchii]
MGYADFDLVEVAANTTLMPVTPLSTPSPVRLVLVAPALLASSTHYGPGLPSLMLRSLSPDEQQLYGPLVQLDDTADAIYHLSDVSCSIPIMISPAAASSFASLGFAVSFPPSSQVTWISPIVEAPALVSHAHVYFVSAIEADPSTPTTVVGSDIRILGKSHNELLDVHRIVDLEDKSNTATFGKPIVVSPLSANNAVSTSGGWRRRNRNRSQMNADLSITLLSAPTTHATRVTNAAIAFGLSSVQSATWPVTSDSALCNSGSWIEVVKRCAPHPSPANSIAPALWQTCQDPPSSTPPPLSGSSLDGDASATIEVSNCSHSGEYQKVNCYCRPNPPGEVVIKLNAAVSMNKDVAIAITDKGKDQVWEILKDELEGCIGGSRSPVRDSKLSETTSVSILKRPSSNSAKIVSSSVFK